MIKFNVSRTEETWYEGHAGHLAFKEWLNEDRMLDNTLRLEGPLSGDQVINVLAAVVKSRSHLTYLLGHPVSFSTNPWELFKASQRNFLTFVERVNANARHEFSLLPTPSSCIIDLMPTQPPPFRVGSLAPSVCATLRRVVNLAEWAATMEIKLTSTTPFKWKNFDSITTSRVYLRA